ncbi:MAG: SpoIIE family protein phosphatase [Ilumatobacteraceae bacterium]
MTNEPAGFDEPIETTFDLAPVGLATTRPDGTIVRANRLFRQRTGWTPLSAGADRIQELLTVGSRIYFETHLAPMLHKEGSADEIALEFVTAEGGRRHALINAVLDRDQDGTPQTIRWAIFAAESRREYECELLAAKSRAERSEHDTRVLSEVVQQALIPAAPPRVAGLDIGTRYRPAGNGHEIGGDFYDVFQLAADEWVMTIGDVQGKGVEAAVITSLARYTIRTAAVEHERPSEVLKVLNTVLRLDETDRLCTAIVVRLQRTNAGWRIELACAGHAPALLRRRDGTISELGEPGQLLGIFNDVDLHDVEGELEPGDTVLAYTDGVTEARRGREWYGDERVREILAMSGHTADALVDVVLRDVLQFEGNNPRDDIAIVALQAT